MAASQEAEQLKETDAVLEHEIAARRASRKNRLPQDYVCPQCGFENPVPVKFCGECGAKITGSPKPHLKRKTTPTLGTTCDGSREPRDVGDGAELGLPSYVIPEFQSQGEMSFDDEVGAAPIIPSELPPVVGVDVPTNNRRCIGGAAKAVDS